MYLEISVSKPILWYLNTCMSSIELATRFKKTCFKVFNELPTDNRHIKVPQERLLCPTHVNNKKKLVFAKNNLSVLHDQTSVASV